MSIATVVWCPAKQGQKLGLTLKWKLSVITASVRFLKASTGLFSDEKYSL